jgi:hypothetical protein
MDTRYQRHVELTWETGHKQVLTLEPGRDTGLWCLTGDGVLRPASPDLRGARLFIRFDGETFAIGMHPSAMFDVDPPASLAAGELQILYRLGPPLRDPDLGYDDVTRVWSSPVPSGEERTRVESRPPMDEWDEATQVAPPLNLGDETAVGPPPRVPALRVAAPPVVAKPKGGRITPIRIGILAMMVTVFALVTVTSTLKRSPAPAPTPKPTAQVRAARPAPSSAASASAGAPAQAVTATEAHTAASVEPADPREPPVARPPAAGSAPLATADGDRERAAVLAVESGAADRAANLYESLAASHPERQAYREAARILRAKAAPR